LFYKGSFPLAIQLNALEYLQNTALRFPDKIAFSDEGESFTFAQLDTRARVAGTYIARNTQAINRPVAVLAEGRAAMIAAFMGVLYSGNFYAPLDRNMPAERFKRVLAQLEPLFIIGSKATRPVDSEALGIPFMDIDDMGEGDFDSDLLASRVARVLDIDPAYAIFTSGSTGVPKGIVISHRALIDFNEWMADTFEFSEKDILANQSPFYFDLSVKDIYLTLKCGATTNIIPKKLFMFPLLLARFIKEKQTTALVWATAGFHLLANSGALEKCAPQTINKIILGGEALYAKQLNIWRQALPHVRYVNLYGPTEVTVDCTYYIIDREYADHEAIPIGIPCENKEVLLLDENLQPVPQGEPGEICVRGIGLARGYYGDWEKTAAAFVQNPVQPRYPDIIYRTGDIGVLNSEGLIQFSTRRDGQIKHMSYRIELGDIESALASLPQIRQNICFYDSKKEKIVCAYAGNIAQDEIVKGLWALLPKYMLPNIFMQNEALPMNANGKIDRTAIKNNYFG
jgi:amino acid adenylation domain-containing protein